MLYIHTSNQLEQLKNQYAAVVREPLNRVFQAETVVVQNAGMARWLSMETANLLGISANTEFLFPAEFMWGLLRLVSSDIPEHSQCAPDTLRFHIFAELSENSLDYPELHHYILNEEQINPLSTWELSCQLAQLLDQYLFYRSDWIREWEAPDWNNEKTTAHWQSRLWNRCVRDKGLLHWLKLQDQFSDALIEFDASLLAERICFFSMSALSPGYVDLLGQVAEKTDIHIFIINPCEDVYWGDIQSPKAKSKMDLEAQELIDVGNPLLASMGKQGRDFIEKLLDLSESNQSNPHAFIDAENKQTLLSLIQKDIYNLNTPDTTQGFYPIDDSIQFNACHTSLREVEVLHDQILAQLDSDSSLAPSDIVVMMPDIEKYAPYIEAIFGGKLSNNKEQKLPFSIADRDPQNIFKHIQAFNKLLKLPDVRFDVEAVFELLEYADIRQQFDISESELSYCRDLARASNIRWGINAKTRKNNQLPETEEHTWKYALDRMLLGYSLADSTLGADQGEQLFPSSRPLDLLAYSEIEGSNALVLANFKRFTDCIFTVNEWQKKTLSLDEWITESTRLLSQLFYEKNADSIEQQRLSNALADILTQATLAEFTQSLPFTVYQKILQQAFSGISANEKYLGYGITFCALVPMRSVPFKIVALMGMNDGEFPRQEQRPSFDLMSNNSRKGDRSRRDEDRYLFLESLLAARTKLLISYVGQSVKDNSELPPSVLVNELLEILAQYTGKDLEYWVTKHPLQAFSPRYFFESSHKDCHKDSHKNCDEEFSDEKHPLFSYAMQYVELQKDKTATPTHSSQHFIKSPLEPLDDSYKILTLETLIQFYKSPARYFLKHRFAIQTFNEDNELNTREPFTLEAFKEREIRHLVLQCQEGEDNEQSNKDKQLIARAKGLLPYGDIGDAIYEKEKHITETFIAQLPELETQENQHISLYLGDFQLTTTLQQLTTQGRAVKQVSKPYVSDYISFWLTHLCLNCYKADSYSYFYSPELCFALRPVENAKEQLKTLLDYYWQGLSFPLLFFPKSSFELFKTGAEKIDNSEKTWNGDDRFQGEKHKFEHSLLYPDVEITKENAPDAFLHVSEAFFSSMMEAMEDV